MIYRRIRETPQIEVIPFGSKQLCREESDRRIVEMVNAMDDHEIYIVLNAIKNKERLRSAN